MRICNFYCHRRLLPSCRALKQETKQCESGRERMRSCAKNHKRITCAWLCGLLFPSALKVFRVFRVAFRRWVCVCAPSPTAVEPLSLCAQVKLKMDQKILKRFASCNGLFFYSILFSSVGSFNSIPNVFLKLLFLHFLFCCAIWFLIISTNDNNNELRMTQWLWWSWRATDRLGNKYWNLFMASKMIIIFFK